MSADVLPAPMDQPLLAENTGQTYADLEPAQPLQFESIYAAMNAPSAPADVVGPPPAKYFEKGESEKQADLENGTFVPSVIADIDENEMREIMAVDARISADHSARGFLRGVKKLAGRFHIRPRRRYIEIRNRQEAEEFYYRRHVGTEIPVFNPQARVDKTSPIGRALAFSQPVRYLQNEGLQGLTAKELLQYNLSMVDFRNYRRTADDLHALWPTLEQLQAAGFKACNFDARLWSLENICRAYKTHPADVCQFFQVGLRDAIAAGTPVDCLSQLGFTSEHIFQDPNCFEVLVALHMTPEQLREHFNLDSAQLSNPDNHLERVHFTALAVLCNWKSQSLRNIGMSEQDVRALMTDSRETVKSVLRASLHRAVMAN